MAKILQINTVSNSGSTGKIVEGIGKMITNEGWKSYSAFGREINNSKYSEEIIIGDKLDFYLHAIGTRLTDRHGFFSKKATLNFMKKLEVINPDIVHLHNIHGYFIHIKLLFQFLKKQKIPVIWTLHDCWSFTGHCAHYVAVNCNKWQTQCNNCPQLIQYPKSYKDSSFQNYKDKKEIFTSLNHIDIVTPSNWLAKEVSKSFLNKYSITVINNGVDLISFSEKKNENLLNKLNIQNPKIVLGVASVWTQRKGYEDFIKLAELLIDKNIILIMVGLNSQQLKKLPNNIIGIQRTESLQQLSDLYSIADIFFNPTYEDNFPTTNIEALACGTPILTYNTGGSPEIIDDNTGWVINQGDLGEAITIIQSFEKTQNVKINCRIRAEQLYNQEIKFMEYINLYKKYL
ncbi:glycosyltransferase [Empedobacter falsenii]|uniref:Glycosyltransferase n=1 Tax=Empedobacter falsenii TaxID=343874 RepID=A0AAW7DKX6_9FLAO|nr:glycosyltransferase [Empedobacter falsenii]MDM1552253.1 glycosyltransferase [Empedobacter falsenii]